MTIVYHTAYISIALLSSFAYADDCGTICTTIRGACSSKGSYCKNNDSCMDLFWLIEGTTLCNHTTAGCLGKRYLKCSEASVILRNGLGVPATSTTSSAPRSVQSGGFTPRRAPETSPPVSSRSGPRTTRNTLVRPVRPRGGGHERLRIVAFGDFGADTHNLRSTMDMYHSKSLNPDLVFLLGDNTYRGITSRGDYSIYFDQVARDSRAPHFAILGNYDYHHGAQHFMLNEMPGLDRRWRMPSNYYFQRFIKSQGLHVCVWFIDTELLDDRSRELRNDRSKKGAQLDWLSASIAAEKATCTWTIVVGHIPTQMQASGPHLGNWSVANALQPILDRHNVDMYLSGHHHNTQHIEHVARKANYFIVGQVSLQHGFTPSNPPNRQGRLVWGGGREPAIIELNITEDHILYTLHSGTTGAPLHSGFIPRS